MAGNFWDMKEPLMPETVSTVHPWLAPFPPHQRPLVAAWFHYALTQGCQTPESMVQLVQPLVASKLEWAVSPTSITLCETTLASLAHRHLEALAFAQTVLEGREVGKVEDG
jgi:hypothetical protein